MRSPCWVALWEHCSAVSEGTGGQASEDAPPGGGFHFTGYVLPPPRAATQAVKISLERQQQQKSVTSATELKKYAIT